MKLIKTLFASLAIVGALASCERETTTTTPKDDTEEETGGTEVGGDDNTGGNTTPDGYIKLSEAYCTFYGVDEKGVGNYYFEIIDGKTDTDGYLVQGTDVCIDIYASNNDLTIPTGTFKAADTYAAGTFATSEVYTYKDLIEAYMELLDMTRAEILELIGITEADFNDDDIYTIYGSSIWYAENEGDEFTAYTVSGGDVNITLDGDTYTILVNFTEGTNEYKYAFTGKVEISDESESDDDDNGDDEDLGDVVFEAISAEAVNYGEDYGDLGCGSYYDWAIYLYDANDDMVELDVLTDTKSGSKVLPTGKFSIKDDGTYYLYEQGCAVPFYYDEDNSYGYGCSFVHNGYYWYGATSGDVTISKEDGKYTVAYNMYDSDYDATFSGTYTGTIEIDDQSTSSVARNNSRRNASYKVKPDNHEKNIHSICSGNTCSRLRR